MEIHQIRDLIMKFNVREGLSCEFCTVVLEFPAIADYSNVLLMN